LLLIFNKLLFGLLYLGIKSNPLVYTRAKSYSAKLVKVARLSGEQAEQLPINFLTQPGYDFVVFRSLRDFVIKTQS